MLWGSILWMWNERINWGSIVWILIEFPKEEGEEEES